MLAGLAEQLGVRAVVAQIHAVQREAAFLRLLGDRVDRYSGWPLLRQWSATSAYLVIAGERPMHAHQALAAGHVEHVALAEQLLGALLAQDRCGCRSCW